MLRSWLTDRHDADSCTDIWDNVRFHSEALVLVCTSKLKVDPLPFGSVGFDVVYACLLKFRCLPNVYFERYNKWQAVTGASWWQSVFEAPSSYFVVWNIVSRYSEGQHFRIHVACRWILLFQPELYFLPYRLLLFPWSVQCDFVHSGYRVRYGLCHPAILIWRWIKLQLFEVLKGTHTRKCGNNWATALLTLFRMNSLLRTSVCVCVFMAFSTRTLRLTFCLWLGIVVGCCHIILTVATGTDNHSTLKQTYSS